MNESKQRLTEEVKVDLLDRAKNVMDVKDHSFVVKEDQNGSVLIQCRVTSESGETEIFESEIKLIEG